MELSVRDTQFSRRSGSQGGQAVIEYILLLVVTIIIVFGATYQFNDAFKAWANNYFGDYLACLLETGELPAIGGTGGVSSSCNDVFKTFSLAEGRPWDGGGGGGGGGNGGGGGDDDGDGGGFDDDDNEGDGSGGGGSAEGGASSGYTKVSRRSGAGFDRDGRFGGNTSGDSAGRGAGPRRKDVYTGSTDSSIPAGMLNGNQGRTTQRQRVLSGEYFISQEKRDETESERSPLKITEGSRVERKQMMIIKRELAEAKPEVEEKEMGFGDYFRYLLIAALIIALVIVIGGQIAQISQEME